jgi:uncharacterized protein
VKIAGQFTFEGIPAGAVWTFLTDPDRIAQCLPGCEKLTRTSDDTYDLQLRFGIGAVSGTFSGSIRLHDLQPPTQFRMAVSGTGSAGFVNGEGLIEIGSDGGNTLLSYSGDVNVGGAIASLGQRMVGGAARMVIDQFFKCVAGKMGT